MDGIGVAEVPAKRFEDAALSLEDLGFGVGGIHEGEEVDGIGVAEVPAHCPGNMFSLEDLGFGVRGVRAGEEVNEIGVAGVPG